MSETRRISPPPAESHRLECEHLMYAYTEIPKQVWERNKIITNNQKKKIWKIKKKIQKENKRNHTDQTVKLSGAKDDVKRRRNVAEMTGHHVRNEVVLQSLLSKYVPT